MAVHSKLVSTAAAPSAVPPTSSPPAASPAPDLGLCPRVLRRTQCSCTSLSYSPLTDDAKLSLLLGRVLKAWARATSRTCPRTLVSLAELVGRVLADRGLPLAHVVVCRIHVGGGGGGGGACAPASRALWSITFLVPSPDVAAHQAVAEMVVGIAGETLEDARARFERDWDDWHVLVRGQFFADAAPGVRIEIPDTRVTGQMVLGRVFVELAELYASTDAHAGGATTTHLDANAFVLTMGAAARVVGNTQPGAEVAAFAVQPVWRLRRGRLDVAARIALLVHTDPDVVGAVVLAEPHGKGDARGVRFVVVLNEEWPIAHIYRKVLLPPIVSGLARLLQD
ncbi:hypothetical protein Q5752_004226 [Cryptotrichosporon argae]